MNAWQTPDRVIGTTPKGEGDDSLHRDIRQKLKHQPRLVLFLCHDNRGLQAFGFPSGLSLRGIVWLVRLPLQSFNRLTIGAHQIQGNRQARQEGHAFKLT